MNKKKNLSLPWLLMQCTQHCVCVCNVHVCSRAELILDGCYLVVLYLFFHALAASFFWTHWRVITVGLYYIAKLNDSPVESYTSVPLCVCVCVVCAMRMHVLLYSRDVMSTFIFEIDAEIACTRLGYECGLSVAIGRRCNELAQHNKPPPNTALGILF